MSNDHQVSSSHTNIPSPRQQNASTSYALSGKIMLTAILVLLFIVIFMITLHIYARWYLLRIRRRYLHRRRSRRQRPSHIVFYIDPNHPRPAANLGLDAAVLRSLPVFVFTSLTHPDGLDCAVCLSEFEENEKGRILPKCHHSFHTDCIDMWFHSHSTCPICRAPVEAEAPIQIPKNQNSEPAASINEALDAETTGSSSEEGRMDTDTTSLADRRNGLDLEGVKIEVPRSESGDEFRLSSAASRLQSLKRILSLNKKSAAVSPSSGIGPSGETAGDKLDVELGKDESAHGQTRVPTPR